ncbi:DUF2510 domain-containing protein [Kineosporia sp. A_224]|uniref:DUF2510 domain-containing protein n=1 Tax=Kineosporia sp. A_224 TaxID=1962180 RepID=UPI000B4B4077|nr:DUF2510 domain-containing protein [Kineosporia sp. A_224]
MNERATFRHELSRTVPGVVGQVRTALLRAVSDDGFTVDVERTTLVEAGRGSTVSGAMSADRLPVRLAVRLATLDDGTRVDVAFWDRWPSAATQVRGLDAMYADLFGRLTALVDRALGTSAPAAVPAGPVPQAVAGAQPAGTPALVDRFGGAAAAKARSALSSADRRLSGVRDDWPQRWARVVGLEVRLPGAEPERFGREDIDGVLDVATLLGAQPGDLPPPLVAHVERIAAAVEGALDSGLPLPVLTLEEPDAPALLFLRQQAALRETLPERRLLVCRDCRLEKLVNDEYRQITEKQRRLTEIVNRVSVVAPAGMLRQAFRLNRMQPDFVCPRCQGLRADAFVVTFCPACGAQQRDGALKGCRCGFDFRAEAVRLLAARPPAEIVLPPEPPVAQPVAQPVAPVRQPAPAGGPAAAASWPSAPTFGGGPTPAPPSHTAPPGPTRAAPLPQVAAQQPPNRTAPPQQHHAATAPGWYADPWRAAPLRWWDGRTWTGWTHPPAGR